MTIKPTKGQEIFIDIHCRNGDGNKEWVAFEEFKKIKKELEGKFNEHRKSNNLWRLPQDESWSLAEDWIDKAFEVEK